MSLYLLPSHSLTVMVAGPGLLSSAHPLPCCAVLWLAGAWFRWALQKKESALRVMRAVRAFQAAAVVGALVAPPILVRSKLRTMYSAYRR